MKTIGLLGGMSWESTVLYYQTINRVVGERLGELHSAKILLHSFDFHEIAELQQTGRWDESGELLARAAHALERAGANLIVICTNTMHKVAPQIEAAIGIPILHIADATAKRISEADIHTVGLLGSRFTMEDDFYKRRLEAKHGLTVLVPSPAEREVVNRIIYEELCRGEIVESSRSQYATIVANLVDQGAKGVILGCTEIGLLLRRATDASVPLFDTAQIHAECAAMTAIGQQA